MQPQLSDVLRFRAINKLSALLLTVLILSISLNFLDAGQPALAQALACPAAEVVNNVADDGSCGTLRYALNYLAANPAYPNRTVQVQLAAGSIIYLKNSGLTVPPNVSINAPCTASGPGLTVLGFDITGDGLSVTGNSRITGLTVGGFSGRQIRVPSTSHTVLSCVVADNPANSVPYSQELISKALQESRISYATSLLYRAYVLFNDPRLPVEFVGKGSNGNDLELFSELQLAKASLTPAELTSLQPYLLRPSHQNSPFSTGATSPSISPNPVVGAGTPCPSSWISSTSPIYPFTVWTSCSGTEYEARKAQIDAVRELATSFWPDMTNLMGQPKPDTFGTDPMDNGNNDDKVDIYLVDLKEVVHHVNERNIYGDDNAVSAPTPAQGLISPTSSSGYMLVRRDRLDTGIGATNLPLKSDMVHEFFHILQFAYNYDTWTPCGNKSFWFDEASATWAETKFARATAPTEVYNLFEQTFQQNRLPLHIDGSLGLDTAAYDHTYSAFIWPYFMEQEKGAQVIANAWKAMQGLTSCQDFQDAVAAQLPFASNYRLFALRNLNRSFDGDNPLETRYHDPPMDPNFPDPYEPDDTRGESAEVLHAINFAAPPQSVTVSNLVGLKSVYYQYQVSPTDNIKQITFDFNGLAPQSNLDVDAVIKFKGRPWTTRRLSGKTRFCANVEEIEKVYLVLSNRNSLLDFNSTKIDGSFTIRPLKEPCNCQNLASATKGWQGTLTYSYNESASWNHWISSSEYAEESATNKRQATVNVYLDYVKDPVRYPYSFLGSITGGTGSIDDKYEEKLTFYSGGTSHTDTYTYTTKGNGNLNLHPHTANSAYTSMFLNFPACNYDITFITDVNAAVVDPLQGNSNEAVMLVSFSLRDFPINDDALHLNGSITWPDCNSTQCDLPLYLSTYDEIPVGSAKGYWPSFKLDTIRGHGDPNKGGGQGSFTISWNLTPIP